MFFVNFYYSVSRCFPLLKNTYFIFTFHVLSKLTFVNVFSKNRTKVACVFVKLLINILSNIENLQFVSVFYGFLKYYLVIHFCS